MGDDLEKTSLALEMDWLDGKNCGTCVYGAAGPKTTSVASAAIIDFVSAWKDPFSPAYPYKNSWVPNKENKTKKDKPADEVVRPSGKNLVIQ